MQTTIIEPFQVIGISVRTSNENQQAATDIPQLWARFFAENILALIPNRIDDTLYCVYTDYESDHTRPYTTLLGCRVDHPGPVPKGLSGTVIEGGAYTQFTARGKMADGIVFHEWMRIWNAGLPRAYTADFEIYGPKAQNPEDMEVDILIALR